MGRSYVTTFGYCVHPQVRMGIDEPRIDRETVQVPDTRTGRRLHIATDPLDESVPDYYRGTIQDLPRCRHNPCAH